MHSLEELLDVVSAFCLLPSCSDSRVGLVCGGGGVSVTATDICDRVGLVVPALSPELQKQLRKLLPSVGASYRNPVDCDNPFPPAEILQGVLETLARSGQVTSIVVEKIALSVRMREILGYADQMGWEEKPWLAEVPIRVRQELGIPLLVVLRDEGASPAWAFDYDAERRQLRSYYQQHGIPVFPTVERALKALARVVAYYRHRAEVRNEAL